MVIRFFTVTSSVIALYAVQKNPDMARSIEWMLLGFFCPDDPFTL